MGKYDVLRKADRNQLLEQYAEEHPEASLKDIGKIFGISKQRVHELLGQRNHQKVDAPSPPDR